MPKGIEEFNIGIQNEQSRPSWNNVFSMLVRVNLKKLAVRKNTSKMNSDLNEYYIGIKINSSTNTSISGGTFTCINMAKLPLHKLLYPFLILTRTSTAFFSITIINRQKRFWLMKALFQVKQPCEFPQNLKSYQKTTLKKIKVRKIVATLWILSSVKRIEVHKKEHRVESNCYKHKKKTKRVKWKHFMTTHTATSTHILSNWPCRLPEKYFRLISCQSSLPSSPKNEKK